MSLGNDPDRPAHFDHLTSAVFRPGFSGAVIAIASISGASFELRPMALYDGDGVRSLDFQLSGGTPKRSFSDFLQKYSRRTHSSPVAYPKPASISVVEKAAAELTGIAETGCRAINRSGSQRLAEIGTQAERIGLGTVAETLARLAAADRSLANQVLISRYIVDQTRLQLTVLPMLRV